MELITAIQNNPIVGLVVIFTRLIYSDFDNFLGGFLIEYWYGVGFFYAFLKSIQRKLLIQLEDTRMNYWTQ